MRNYWVYILSSKRNGTIYIGVTGNLQQRVCQHKSGIAEGFTKKYSVDQLVYFEQTSSVHAALDREKQLKGWKRSKKLELIESVNPHWEDLDPSLRSG